jgi:Ca-activated chloride channel family protein
MLELVWPWAFLLTPLPLLVYFIMPTATREDAALHAPFYQRLASINPTSLSRTRQTNNRLNLWLGIIAWLFLILAATQPQWLGEPVSLPTTGRDLMLAVDISGSMKVEDLQLDDQAVTRLAVVKKVVSEFIERRKGDRIGLILFGSNAYLQVPLTFDRNTVKTLLLESQIGFAGEQTAIGNAIGLAVKRLRNRPQQSRVLILLTDGANTAGEIEPLKAAEIAAQETIKIHTIGVGANEMITPGLFGSNFGSRRVNPSADLDETTLKGIATATGGQYFRAHNTEQLTQIYALLDQIEPVKQDDELFIPKRSLYIWPLAFSLLISLLITTMKLKPTRLLMRAPLSKKEVAGG